MSKVPSYRDAIVVPSCILLPIPVAIIALWLWPEKEGMGVDLFIVFGAFPIGWSFTGILCWAFGCIGNEECSRTFLGFPVKYWGQALFLVGFGLSLLGLWGMYRNGLFPYLPAY